MQQTGAHSCLYSLDDFVLHASLNYIETRFPAGTANLPSTWQSAGITATLWHCCAALALLVERLRQTALPCIDSCNNNSYIINISRPFHLKLRQQQLACGHFTTMFRLYMCVHHRHSKTCGSMTTKRRSFTVVLLQSRRKMPKQWRPMRLPRPRPSTSSECTTPRTLKNKT
jgi:hypothetical protein